MSFHYSVRHFHVEEGHCQDTLQQRRAQRLRQCIPCGLPGSLSWVLVSNNAGLNVLDNAPLAVYQVALAGYWLATTSGSTS